MNRKMIQTTQQSKITVMSQMRAIPHAQGVKETFKGHTD